MTLGNVECYKNTFVINESFWNRSSVTNENDVDYDLGIKKQTNNINRTEKVTKRICILSAVPAVTCALVQANIGRPYNKKSFGKFTI